MNIARSHLVSDASLCMRLGQHAIRVARIRLAPQHFNRTAFASCDLAEDGHF